MCVYSLFVPTENQQRQIEYCFFCFCFCLFVFLLQAFYPMKRVEVAQGDWLVARCTYNNDRNDAVRVG